MLNVFYIRPSDNGYYGIAEALLGQPRTDVRVRTSLYRSTQFPLTYPLPRRLDAQMQGWHGLQSYQLIVLAGIDPEVLSPKEMRDITAFVERGGGLLVVGGTTSGSARIGTWEPLRSVLPVAFLNGEDVAVNAPAKAGGAHAVTRGLTLPAPEAVVQSVHAVRVAKGAKVLMKAKGHPLLVAGDDSGGSGRGRTLFLNGYPQCGGAETRCFFTDRFYPDLIRQAAVWLTHGDTKDGIQSVRPVKSVSPGTKLRVGVRVGGKGKATLVARLSASAPGNVLGGKAIAHGTAVVRRGGSAGVTVEVPAAVGLAGELTLGVELREGEAVLGYRGFTVAVASPVQVAVRLDSEAASMAPGMTLKASVVVTDRRSRKTALVLSARVVGPGGPGFPGGEAVHEWRKAPAEKEQRLEWKLPDVAAGSYAVEVGVGCEEGKPALGRGVVRGRKEKAPEEAHEEEAPLRVARVGFAVVDPMDNQHYYPLVSEAMPGGGAVCPNPADLRGMVDDVAGHGFNAVMFGDAVMSEPATNVQRVRRDGERHAQERGLRVVTAGHLVPDYSRTRPPEPCVYDPAFAGALEKKVGPLLDQGDLIPRHFMSEILDEPLIAGAMICRCPRCRGQFQKRFGYSMPEWEVSCRPGMEAQRTDLLAFAADYWAEIFKRCYEFKKARGVRFDVHHTLCQLTWGTFVSKYYWRSGFAWMPYCDRFDWDTYPYIYPIWRGHQSLHAPNLRHHFAGHRSLARHFGKPMGHWLDLSDRNVPHWVPPVRASSELVYTAIGQDTKLIRTFYNINFGRNNGVRRERWDDLGAELNKIGRYASVLTLARKPYEPVAMLFAGTDWALRHHTSVENLPKGTVVTDFPLKWDDAPFDDQYPFAGTPWNAYELLVRSFGEAALLPEEMVAAGELKRHKALAIWGAKFVVRAAAKAAVDFVRAGGLLLCDGAPEKDERGAPLQGLRGIFGEHFEPVCDDLAMAVRRTGKGHTLLFNQNINAWYTAAVVAGDARKCADLQAAIRGFLAQYGVLPHARPGDPEFEVDVLAGRDCFFVVAVNHAEEDRQTVIEMPRPPAAVGWVMDLGTGLEVPFAAREEGATLRLGLGTRRGAILGVYPRQPVANALKVSTPRVARGEVLAFEAHVLDGEGKNAPGHHPIEIVVRDSAGQERARYGGRKATTGGVYKRAVPIAINERPGKWEIELRDLLTRRVSRAAVEVL